MANNDQGKGYVVAYTIEVNDAFSKKLDEFSKLLSKVEKQSKNVVGKVGTNVANTSKVMSKEMSRGYKETADLFDKINKKHLDAAKIIEAQQIKENSFFSNFKNNLRDTGSQMRTFGRATTFSVALPIAAFGIGALKSAASVQKMESNLRVFTKSGSAANKMIEELRTASDMSTFSFEEYGNSARMLLQQNIPEQNVTGQVKKLADLAAVSNLSLEFLTDAFANSMQTETLDTRAIQTLSRQGIRIFEEYQKYIEKKTGKKFSLDRVKKLMGEGRISAKSFTAVIDQMTSRGGVAFNGMNKTTNNLEGSFLRLKNSSVRVLQEVGKAMDRMGASRTMDKMATGITKFSKGFSEFSQKNPALVKNVALLAGALVVLPPLIYAIGAAFSAIAAMLLANPLILAIAGVVAGATFLLANQPAISTWMDKNVHPTERNAAFVKSKTENPAFQGFGLTENRHSMLGLSGWGARSTPVSAQQIAATQPSSGEITINIKDPGNTVKSVDSKQSGWGGWNLGINNREVMAK